MQVDPKGTYMGELPQPEQPDYVQKAGTTLSHSQQFYTKMQPVERSMYMWRRINAGCVESTTRWPNPTYKDHFPHDLSNAEKPDKRHHLKKTDFTDFTECKIKQGHAGADR